MNRDQQLKILKSPKANKEQLRVALASALGVEYEPESKEKQQTVFNRCQAIFCELYKKDTNVAYMFEARDGKALTQLISKVSGILEYVSDDNIITAFRYLIEKLPIWYKQKAYSLRVIDNKFNEIAASIKLDGKGKSKVSDSYREQLRRDLRS